MFLLCVYHRDDEIWERDVCVTSLLQRKLEEEGCVLIKVKQHKDESMLTPMTHLQPVDQFFLYCILSCSISGNTEPLSCLSEPLLLVLILWVGSRPLRAHKHTHTSKHTCANVKTHTDTYDNDT